MFAAPAEPIWAGRHATTQASAPPLVVPFHTTRGNLVTVHGAIGHIDDLQFLVDTGTSDGDRCSPANWVARCRSGPSGRMRSRRCGTARRGIQTLAASRFVSLLAYVYPPYTARAARFGVRDYWYVVPPFVLPRHPSWSSESRARVVRRSRGGRHPAQQISVPPITAKRLQPGIDPEVEQPW